VSKPASQLIARVPWAARGRGSAWSVLEVLRFARTAIVFVLLVAIPLRIVEAVAVEGWTLHVWPYDLGVFLQAGHAVLHGLSPYPAVSALRGDANYVYPPLLALLVAPFAALPLGPAVFLWTALLAVAIPTALFLLGVRDWRCYGVAFLWPPTREAIDTGALGPLLLLGVALAWRYRDRRPVVAAAAAAVTMTLKLFLVPLVVWLAATRRFRAALLAAAGALVLALGSWAVIGFDGLTAYPHLLRRLSQEEADRSYSLVAIGHRLGLPSSLAFALALVVGGALLAAAISVARRGDGDRLALSYAIAAALALTPIAWKHYFVLLLVPLALARPWFSLAWLVPLALSAPIVPSGWPQGNARSLAVLAAVSAVIVAVAVRERRDRLAAWL
jgi:alpha-1,2-mannosyltransferase